MDRTRAKAWQFSKRTRGRRKMQMLHDLTVNSDYATLKQTAGERMMWRHSRGISRTWSTAEDWRERERTNVRLINEWPTNQRIYSDGTLMSIASKCWKTTKYHEIHCISKSFRGPDWTAFRAGCASCPRAASLTTHHPVLRPLPWSGPVVIHSVRSSV